MYFLHIVSSRLKPSGPCVYLQAMDPTVVVQKGNTVVCPCMESLFFHYCFQWELKNMFIITLTATSMVTCSNGSIVQVLVITPSFHSYYTLRWWGA